LKRLWRIALKPFYRLSVLDRLGRAAHHLRS
jgi:hypothetical protein